MGLLRVKLSFLLKIVRPPKGYSGEGRMQKKKKNKKKWRAIGRKRCFVPCGHRLNLGISVIAWRRQQEAQKPPRILQGLSNAGESHDYGKAQGMLCSAEKLAFVESDILWWREFDVKECIWTRRQRQLRCLERDILHEKEDSLCPISYTLWNMSPC